MAGEYVEFHNNAQPALNETNVNRMQRLIKQDIVGTVGGDTMPIGAIVQFGSSIIPTNWLLCDGSEVSRTTYQDLFDIIGITYGQGDGFSTFNLPDLIDTDIIYIIKATQSAGVVATVVDNLNSTSTTDALSANQGKAIKELLEGTVLYENSEGITTGDIVLNESMTAYKRLVFYSPDGQWLGEQLIDGATSIKLQQFDQGSQNTMLRISRINITNNTTLTFYTNVPTYYDGSTWSRNSTSYVTVGKVVGYQY